jgi:hypothetical protein
MVLDWVVGTGGTSYHFLATVCLAILRFCEFVLFCFVCSCFFGVAFFFGLRYPLPSTGGWAYIFLASLDVKWLKELKSYIIPLSRCSPALFSSVLPGRYRTSRLEQCVFYQFSYRHGVLEPIATREDVLLITQTLE